MSDLELAKDDLLTSPLDATPDHSDATSDYLSRLAAASQQIVQGIEIPMDPSQLKASVSTTVDEKQMRTDLAIAEQVNKQEVFDDLLANAILQGAGPKEVDAILEAGPFTAKEQVNIEEKSKDSLERNAAKWLVDEGLADEERAAAVLSEEFSSEGKPTETDERQEFVHTLLRLETVKKKLMDKLEGMSLGAKALDFAAMLIPGHTTITSAKMFGRGAATLGASIEEFVTNFWNQPLDKRIAILNDFEKNLEDNTVVSQNIFSAIEQINDLIEFKSDDALGRTIIEGLDALIVVTPIIKMMQGARTLSSVGRIAGNTRAGIERVIGLRETDRKVSKASKTVEAEDNTLPAMMRADQEDELVEGSVPSALAKDVDIEKPSGVVQNELEGNDLLRMFEGEHAAEDVIGSVHDMALAEAELAKGVKLADDVEPTELLQILDDSIVPGVLSSEEQAAANRDAIRALMLRYGIDPSEAPLVNPEGITGGLVSSKHYPMYDVDIDNVSGIRTVNVYLGHGTNKLKGYATEASAHKGAARLGLDERFYSLSNQSGRWFIKVSKNPGTVPYINPLKADEIPEVLPVLGKWIQSSRHVTSFDQVMQARLSVGFSSRLAKGIQQTVGKINKLGKDSRSIYTDMMVDIQQKEKWKTLDEVRSWYVQNHNRLPSQKEEEAYIATRHLYKFDYVIRNNVMKSELVANGYQEVMVRGVHKSPTVGKVVQTTSVEPTYARIWDARSGDFVEFASRKELANELKSDPQLVLVKTLEESPNHGQYIIATRGEVQERALRAQVMNRVDGPHRIYEGENFVKQQRFRWRTGKETMVNPKTHFVLKSKKEAEEFAKDYNEALMAYRVARRSRNNQNKAAAGAIINRNTRYATYDEFDAAVKSNAIELTPFEVVKNGELPSYRLNESDLVRNLDPDFANMSDDTKAMIEAGRLFYSKRGPRLPHPKAGLASLLNPDEILSRSITNIVNTASYNNYKIRQVNRWMETFGRYLEGYSPDRPAYEQFIHRKFDHSPNAKFKLPANVYEKAEAQRLAIQRFIGQPDIMEIASRDWRNKIIDYVDGKGYAGLRDRFANITSKDPVVALRGFAFKAYLGMLDASQLFVQLSMLPGVVATHPVHAVNAFSALPFFRGAVMNPSHLDSFFKAYNFMTAGKGMDAAKFKALFTDMQRLGIDIVDGNLSELDNIGNAANLKTIFGHRTKKITDGMTVFFNESERANRMMGFSIAWLDHANKTGKFPTTAEELASVSAKGDTLAGNMLRDSKAAWQNGMLSVPAQFAAFPARVTEALLNWKSKKLWSSGERARYYTGLALAYGPMLGVGGFTLESYIRNQYTELFGEEPNEDVMNLAMNGVVGSLFPETETQRLQPFGGTSILGELTDGRTPVSDVLAGPSGKLAVRFVNSIFGTGKLSALVTGDVDLADGIGVTVDIAHDALKTIASYNRMDKAIAAYQTGLLFSSQGHVLQTDLDRLDAILLGLGFPPRESTEAFEASIAFKDIQTKVRKDAAAAVHFIRKAINAEEGSAEARRNWAYFHYLARINNRVDLGGDGRELFAKEVDRVLAQTGGLNDSVRERFERELKIKTPTLKR